MVRDASVLELWSEGPYALVSPATYRSPKAGADDLSQRVDAMGRGRKV